MRRTSARWRRTLLFASAVVVVAAASGVAAFAQRPEAKPKKTKVLQIGALLDLTSGWTSLGKASLVTLRLAVADANRGLAKAHSNTRVHLRLADVHGKPGGAVAGLRSLAGEGVRIFVGPQSSAEVKAVRPVADSIGAVVISQGSTAHSLAIAGDNVYRFVPDDRREAEALVELLVHDGTRAIVPVWLNDTGNSGLVSSVRSRFATIGGLTAAGAPYPATERRFRKQVASLERQVAGLEVNGETRIGVYVAGFGEVVDLFHAAARDRALARLPWYGSDGVALNPALVHDRKAAAFAAATGYPNPILGLDAVATRRSASLRARARAALGSTPDAFALTAYDALQVAVLASQRAGPTWNTERFKQALEGVARGYPGVSGRLLLNAAGDRAYGSFDFWSVCARGHGHFAWERTFSYLASGVGNGQIVQRPGCRR